MKRFLPLLLVAYSGLLYSQTLTTSSLPEAPTGFDTLTNGFTDPASMSHAQVAFEEDEVLPALGPVYNARSCGECHTNPVTGANSQVSEHRIAPNATLIHDRAVNAALQESAPIAVFSALRMSLSTMGDGFVEAVPDDELMAIASANGGQFIMVPVLESPGISHVGRFGWKDQHASLLSFSGDASFNEMGIENRLVQASSGSNGIEDASDCSGGEDIDCYALFMRALKAPPRGPITTQVTAGQAVFTKAGCATCHVATLTTSGLAPHDVQFHPYGDFLLHDIGTGDGIKQGSAPANKVRTAPLWGLRTRPRLLHDGSGYDVATATLRHKNEAHRSINNVKQLSAAEIQALLAFLHSL